MVPELTQDRSISMATLVCIDHTRIFPVLNMSVGTELDTVSLSLDMMYVLHIWDRLLPVCNW